MDIMTNEVCTLLYSEDKSFNSLLNAIIKENVSGVKGCLCIGLDQYKIDILETIYSDNIDIINQRLETLGMIAANIYDDSIGMDLYCRITGAMTWDFSHEYNISCTVDILCN